MFVDSNLSQSPPLRRFARLLFIYKAGFIFALLLSFFESVIYAGTPSKKPEKKSAVPRTLIIQFHDLPGVQFAGYLAALKYGFYAQEGLDNVELRWRNDVEDPLKTLENNRSHFATSWMAEGILARSQGNPIVAVALVAQGSSACVMIRRDLFPDIEDISALEDKKVSVWFRYESIGRTFLAKHKIDSSIVVQYRETCQLFSLGFIHAMIATTWNNKPRVNYLLYRDAIRYIPLKEKGCDYPEDTLFCNETFLRKHPDLCRKFVQATFRGWQKVAKDPGNIIELLSNHCAEFGMNSDQFVLREQLDGYLSVFQPPSEPANNGYCNQARFERLVDDMIFGGLIGKEKRPTFRDFFVPVLGQATSASHPVKSRVSQQPATQRADDE